MAMLEETRVETTLIGSIHEIEGTLAFTKTKGNFFTLFYSFEDAMAHTNDGATVSIIKEFDSEDDLIVFLGDCETCSACEEVLLPDSECYTDHESGDACCTECCFYDEADDVYRKGDIETYLKTLKADREDDEADANLISENKAMGDFLENQLGFSQNNVSDIANGNANLYCVHVVYAGVLQIYKLFTKIEDAHTEYVKLCEEWYREEGLSDFSNEFDSEVEYYDSYYMSREYQKCCDDVNVSWEVLSEN